ncbi:MAG: hypothetical protein ACXQTN_04710 [Methanoculleaceae archaeon]
MSIDDEQALSEVIGFILILGLLVVFLSIYNLYVVPAQGREREIEHMNEIRDRFINYKISLDNMWMTENGTGITLSTAFDLSTAGSATAGGGFMMPVVSPIPSTGALCVGRRGDSISIIADGEVIFDGVMGDVSLEAQNNYFVPQTYYYQMGGIFLEQYDGTSVRVSPSLSIYRLISPGSGSGNATVVKCVPITIHPAFASYTTGRGMVRLDTRLRYPVIYESRSDLSEIWITVHTDDPRSADAWRNVFRDAVWRAGFDITIDDPGYFFYISNETPADVTLHLSSGTYGSVIIDKIDLSLIEPSYIVTLQTVTTGA